MELDLFVVNAFSQTPFCGNPAGVCILDAFLSDQKMQAIAQQNNLPETAFLVEQSPGEYQIRWFAPEEEVDFCGHATLASAYVLYQNRSHPLHSIVFQSKVGSLTTTQENGKIVMNLPARKIEPIERPPAHLLEAFNQPVDKVLGSDDYIVVLFEEAQLTQLEVDLALLSQLDRRGVVFTAPGKNVDFVSRVFHPKLGIGEDPVCGSAHCQLVSYWSQRLHKTQLTAVQCSLRGGELYLRLNEDRVLLSGYANVYLKGKIYI